MLLVACVSLLLSAGVPVAKPASKPGPKPTSSIPTLKAVGDGKLPVFAVGKVVRTSVDTANLRGDPSTDNKPIATLPFGTEVRVVEAAKTLTTIGQLTQRWYRVETIDREAPATGWLFGNALTTLGSSTWSASFGTSDIVVRFFRAGATPTTVSTDLDFYLEADTLQAIPGPPLRGRGSVLVRACAGGSCADFLVGEGAENAAELVKVPASKARLSAKELVVGVDEGTFRGRPFLLEPLSRPKSNYTEAELVERFLKDCNDVVRVTVPDMFGNPVVLPQCEVRNFEQNCTPDICWGVQEGCLEGCGKTCGGCDTACGGACSACMNRCTNDVCRRQCAKSRLACFNGCVNRAQTCRSSGCAGTYSTCLTTTAVRIEQECGGLSACRMAASCTAVDGTCPKQSAWCNETCYDL